MKIHLTNGEIKAVVTAKPDKIDLDSKELYTLIQNAFGYSLAEECICGLYEDTYHYTEKYGDKADKKLLRLIKIRLEKSKEQLEPVTRSWDC